MSTRTSALTTGYASNCLPATRTDPTHVLTSPGDTAFAQTIPKDPAIATAPDDEDMSDKICYERPNGVCRQRTAWIEHLLAIDLYRAAVVAATKPDRTAKLERAAHHARGARKYHRPDGGEGFAQCIDTLALDQLIQDASVHAR